MMPVDGVTCEIATTADMVYIVSLQNDNRESVGHLPTPAIEERVSRGTVSLGRLNGEPFGYILFDVRSRGMRVHQACIQYDARRRAYGASLFEWTVSPLEIDLVRLKCAADLESNLFWRSLGFHCLGIMQGGRRRGRKINVWERHETKMLFSPSALSVVPAAQVRSDCRYDETDYIDAVPDGFADAGTLEGLSWKNYKEIGR